MAKVGRLVKELMVKELTDSLQEHGNFFVTNVGPLEAAETDTLRKKLRTAQARMLMVKRTIGMQGLKALGINGGTSDLFTGSVAVIVPPADFVPVAKVLVDFAKESQEKLTVRGGRVEGQLLDKKGMEELAALPAKPQLIANVIFALEGPISDLVFTLESALGEIAYVLEEASKTRPQAAAPAASAAETAPAAPSA